MTETVLAFDELEKKIRQLDEEIERRDEEERKRVAQFALAFEDKHDALRKVKDRRRASISISRLGKYNADDSTSTPAATRPSTPSQASSLAASSPFYQSQIANDSTSSFASGASAFSNDNAHAEDSQQVTQIQQIIRKTTLSKIIPRRLSRARSQTFLSPTPSTLIDVAVQETTVSVSTSAHEAEGDSATHFRRASVTAPGAIRKTSSAIIFPSSTKENLGPLARLTQKFKRKSRQDIPPTPTSPMSPPP